MKHNICDTQTFLLDNGSLVLFTEECYAGMVGECVEVLRAQLLINPLDNHRVEKRELEYEELRRLYREQMKADGKAKRIQFWYWMKRLSPDAVKQRADDTHADAIRRVI